MLLLEMLVLELFGVVFCGDKDGYEREPRTRRRAKVVDFSRVATRPKRAFLQETVGGGQGVWLWGERRMRCVVAVLAGNLIIPEGRIALRFCDRVMGVSVLSTKKARRDRPDK